MLGWCLFLLINVFEKYPLYGILKNHGFRNLGTLRNVLSQESHSEGVIIINSCVTAWYAFMVLATTYCVS